MRRCPGSIEVESKVMVDLGVEWDEASNCSGEARLGSHCGKFFEDGLLDGGV